MFSKKKTKFLSTVTLRLSLLFVLLFTLLLIGVLIPIDITLRSILINRLDARISAHLGISLTMGYCSGGSPGKKLWELLLITFVGLPAQSAKTRFYG